MKAMYNNTNRTQLIKDCMLVVFVFGTIGISLKFVTFFGQWVYFPPFPNALDSTFLVSAVVYLAWRTRRNR